MFGDLWHTQVARTDERFDKPVARQLLSFAQGKRACRDVLDRRQPLLQGVCRSDQDAILQSRHGREYAQPLRDDVLVRRKRVPRQRLPLDEMLDGQVRTGEKTHFGLQLIGVAWVLPDQQHGPLLLAGQFGDSQCQAGAQQASPPKGGPGIR